MIIGMISDTHEDRMNAIPHIIREFCQRRVDMIIHCGDIEPEHLSAELFSNLPVICALTEDQVGKKAFKTAPPGWVFTKPGQRIVQLGKMKVYVGHKMSFDFLTGSESKLMNRVQELRKENDSLRMVCSGHTHHQIFSQTRLTNFINPGAVADSFDGFEFAVVDTEKEEVVFSRISSSKPAIAPFSVGVISDSANISGLDPGFWPKLAEEFRKRGVKYVIHVGNISTDDVGQCLEGFEVYYNLHPSQRAVNGKWHLIDREKHVIELEKYRFYVWHDLGAEILRKSELDMHKLCLRLRRKHPDLNFLLCGLTNDAFLEEGQQIRIINPGDVVNDENLCIISLPRNEITFGHIPKEPLPPL